MKVTQSSESEIKPTTKLRHEPIRRFAFTRNGVVVCRFCGWPEPSHTTENNEPVCVPFDNSLI